jgi:CRAL/TRIO domain
MLRTRHVHHILKVPQQSICRRQLIVKHANCAPGSRSTGCSSGVGTGWCRMKTLGLFMQEHYCERMSRCFVINAPGFFHLLWR